MQAVSRVWHPRDSISITISGASDLEAVLSFQRDRDIGNGGGEDEWGPGGGKGHGSDDTPGYGSGDGGGCALLQLYTDGAGERR